MDREMPIPFRCIGGPRDGTTENMWPNIVRTETVTFLENSLHSPTLRFSEYSHAENNTLVFVRYISWEDTRADG